ncbi:GntR family transcriptional regulator [Microbacterium sp. NPDC076895]|uniref:GntR family transcriptional regulator n=1 Tax=Microbacterium sp. NPDC076895 TaxID=3154957 RepID=UPI003435C431
MPVPSTAGTHRPLLRDEVQARLRAAIVDGTLAPGEQVRDADIAHWLGVSRTPVREALLELAGAGLVHTTPGRATIISPIEPRAIREARDVVAAMHRLAALGAVPRLDREAIERMRAANRRFSAAVERGDIDGAIAADELFHGVLVEVADSDAVRTVLRLYEPVLLRAERAQFSSERAELSTLRHEQLIARCARGDAAGAAEIAESIWTHLLTESDISAPTTHTAATEENETAPHEAS